MLLKKFPYLMLIILLANTAMPASAARKMVAAVLTSDIDRYRDAHRAFVKSLESHGYNPSNIEIVTQMPNPDPISWANSVRKCGAIGADVIVTYGAPVTLAAMRESVGVPVVFVDVYGPVESGISRSMTSTGNNSCGISSKVPLITLIKAMDEISPVKTLGVIYNSREIGSLVQFKELRRVAAQHGFYVVEANVATPSGLDSAMKSLRAKADCFFVTESSVASHNFDRIMAHSREAKIPVISSIPNSAEKGALVALEISPEEQGSIAGDYVSRILGGKKPGQLPVATPKRIELIINMHTARSLGLHVPFKALSMATRILK